MNSIRFIKAGIEMADMIWKMQTAAFSALYEKYQDAETNPAAEPLEKVLERFQQPFTHYYLIEWNAEIVGAIRVVDHHEPGKAKRISPIFVLEPYQHRGIAQQAIAEAEKLHGSDHWELETILEEPGLCRLYERAGYVQSGKTEKLSDKATLVFYQKNM